MITNINEFKNSINEDNLNDDQLLQKIIDLNYSTEKIFGKFGTTNMCDGIEFYDSIPSGSFNLDKAINQLPIENVPIELIYPTQLSISYDAFSDKLTGKPKDENDLPFMIHNNLGYFIFDGHHRCALSKLRGDKTIKSKVFTDSSIKNINENISNYKIVETKKDHRTTISLIDNKTNKTMGKVILDEIYIDSTPSSLRFGTVGDEYAIDDYIYLRYINVDQDYRGQNLSKILLQETIKFANKLGIYEIYLFATPDADSNLNLDQLVKLYSSFGFKELNRIDEGVDMVLEI